MEVICGLNSKKTVSHGVESIIQQNVFRVGVLGLLVATGILSGCSDTPSGNVVLNQADGMVINPPEFLQSRAIVQNNLTAYVSVVADGVSYDAVQTNSTSSPWIGQVFVPEGSSPTVSVTWVETQVPDLPTEYNGELPLAIVTASVDNIVLNESLVISTDQYDTAPDGEDNSLQQLDVDADGFSNIVERQAGSRAGDLQDIPSNVLVLYNEQAPIIDGLYDSLWNTAQFRNQQDVELGINNVLVDEGVVDLSMSREFKWASMHDGTYLYLLVLAESGDDQTPTGDSEVLIYNDDSVDIYWDGNNSKGASYDGVDDFHIIVGLLAGEGGANSTSDTQTRIQIGDRSAPIDLAAVQFAVCLCDGAQQAYEFRFDLEELKIPVDSTFGFEVNINNDADGEVRDAKWAWFNDTGIDDTWRFPLRMGNVRLEPVPE